MTTGIERLQDRLREAGATVVDQRDNGAFREVTYRLNGLIVRLVAEYGTWRANIGFEGEPPYPAAFWLAALDGGNTFPEPPVTEEDLSRLADRIAELLGRAADAAPLVADMGAQYSRAMRERLQ